MVKIRPNSLFRYLGCDFVKVYFSREILLNAIPVFFLILMFHSVFTGVKASMPFIADYRWDQSFAWLDKTLHFGVDPWQLMSTALNRPVVTFFFSLMYFFWFFAMFGFLLWQIFDLRNGIRRMQFLLSFVVTWIILGNILAVIFASGGPCFFHYFEPAVSPNPFDEHMQYLDSANLIYPIWAVSSQEVLLNNIKAGEISIGAGISAMPSLHVAMATLFLLLASNSHKIFGLIMGLYLVIIQIGSVHLGWHYAVDGYVSILLTATIWKLVGLWLSSVECLSKSDVRCSQTAS